MYNCSQNRSYILLSELIMTVNCLIELAEGSPNGEVNIAMVERRT